jgi:hypothetical protein
MSTQTYDSDIYEDGQQFKDDAKLVVRFEFMPIKNHVKSIEQGRPVFDDVEYITIIIPGQRDNLVTEVTEQYRNRFAKQYENWKSRTEDPTSGTPLKELPWMSVSQVAEFSALNVKTVEQLLGLSDAVAQKFMGFQQLKARAQRFLDAAKDAAPDLKMEAALQARDEQITLLQSQMQDLMKRLQETEKPRVAAPQNAADAPPKK